jgi:hypothetical protein
MIRERLATLSSLKRFPGEKSNKLVSTLWRVTERSGDGK